MIQSLPFFAYRPSMAFSAEEKIFETLRLNGSVYCRSSLGLPWKLMFQQHPCSVFHIVESGHAVLELNGVNTTLLAGDFVLLPRGTAHTVRDRHDTPGARVPSILMQASDPCRNDTWTQKAPDAVVLCGTFHLPIAQHQFINRALPEVIHIQKQEWVSALLKPLSLEAQTVGASAVMNRICETLFMQAIRHALSDMSQHKSGWISGLADPHISLALGLMHEHPQKPWTVSSLAKAAALSRSVFAKKFVDTVGETPLSYLTRWRMHVATGWLQNETWSLAEVAERCGYESEVAFHRAYKRLTSLTPGQARNAP
jgi:AraC-like DNA-binding protein